MVEESIFINEGLNQMRSFLSTWSFLASKAPASAAAAPPPALWPLPADLAFGKFQVIDSEDPDFIARGYNKDVFVAPKHDDGGLTRGGQQPYANGLKDGVDAILTAGLLEYLR